MASNRPHTQRPALCAATSPPTFCLGTHRPSHVRAPTPPHTCTSSSIVRCVPRQKPTAQPAPSAASSITRANTRAAGASDSR
eukprot:366004-Chlamydomonas_euryale.AAC.1